MFCQGPNCGRSMLENPSGLCRNCRKLVPGMQEVKRKVTPERQGGNMPISAAANDEGFRMLLPGFAPSGFLGETVITKSEPWKPKPPAPQEEQRQEEIRPMATEAQIAAGKRNLEAAHQARREQAATGEKRTVVRATDPAGKLAVNARAEAGRLAKAKSVEERKEPLAALKKLIAAIDMLDKVEV